MSNLALAWLLLFRILRVVVLHVHCTWRGFNPNFDSAHFFFLPKWNVNLLTVKNFWVVVSHSEKKRHSTIKVILIKILILWTHLCSLGALEKRFFDVSTYVDSKNGQFILYCIYCITLKLGWTFLATVLYCNILLNLVIIHKLRCQNFGNFCL